MTCHRITQSEQDFRRGLHAIYNEGRFTVNKPLRKTLVGSWNDNLQQEAAGMILRATIEEKTWVVA